MSLYDTCLGQNWLTKLLFWNCWPWSYCIGIVYRLGIINQVRNVGTSVIQIVHLSTGMAAISPRTKGFGCTKYNLKLASLETCTHAPLLCTWAESRRGLQHMGIIDSCDYGCQQQKTYHSWHLWAVLLDSKHIKARHSAKFDEFAVFMHHSGA